MLLIYIAGPYTAPTRAGIEANIERATLVALDVAALGVMPVCPHANTGDARFSDVQPYQFWIAGTLDLLRKCDAIVLVDGWRESNGARGEVDEARGLGMPICGNVGELKELIEHGTIQTTEETCMP